LIKVGDKVRSYDFPHSREFWCEGVVEGFKEVEGCDRYKIRIQKQFVEGKEVQISADRMEAAPHIYPPVNGTRRALGGVCNGVELLQPKDVLERLQEVEF